MRWWVEGFLESLGSDYRDKLLGSYKPEGLEKWFFRSRTQLEGLSPAQAIAIGKIDQVKYLIDILAQGDFT